MSRSRRAHRRACSAGFPRCCRPITNFAAGMRTGFQRRQNSGSWASPHTGMASRRRASLRSWSSPHKIAGTEGVKAAMKVLYFAVLRDVTGKKEEDWQQREATVGDLLRDLVAQYGHPFERWVIKDGDLWDLVIVLVNGHDVRHMQRFNTPLAPADTVVIFPPVGGG